MGKLPYYKSLWVKEKFFIKGQHWYIKTKEGFDKMWDYLEILSNNEEFCFRGCSEAKYKIFNSAQRFWAENDLSRREIKFESFIKNLIENTLSWNGSTIARFFEQNGISKTNELACLSHMQHYGLPTQLLDFTSNPFIALYFAVENTADSTSNEEVDHFHSLYIFNGSNQYFSEVISEFDETIKLAQNSPIDYENDLVKRQLLYIGSKNAAYRILNNINILNQKGVFFFNAARAIPIEEVYQEIMKGYERDFGHEQFLDRGYQEKFAECINIHKSLRHYALSKLASKNVTKEYVFPELRKLAEMTITETLTKV